MDDFLRQEKRHTRPGARYLRNTRIEAAMRRLAATEQSIGEITDACGYADLRSFRRSFRELTGLSPREDRTRFTYARRAWPH